jgi:precorrin-6B methylase 2
MNLYFYMKAVILIFFICLCESVRSQARSDTSINYTFSHATADGTGKYFMGREIAQVMGPGGIDWLERPERLKEENIELAISKMNLKSSSVVADIGAGSGYYSFRIASKVPLGKVYAVEVQHEMIVYLEKKKKATGAKNVQVIQGDTMDVHLPQHVVDLAIMVDVYHELAFPKEIVQSIAKSLKPDGKIILIEYRGEDPEIPIKALHKTTITQLNKEFDKMGFSPFYSSDFLPIQHFMVFKKNGNR